MVLEKTPPSPRAEFIIRICVWSVVGVYLAFWCAFYVLKYQNNVEYARAARIIITGGHILILLLVFIMLSGSILSLVILSRSSAISPNVRLGLLRSIVLFFVLLMTAGFRFAIFYIGEGAPRGYRYYIPEWMDAVDLILVHTMQVLCLLLIVVMASRQFVRQSTVESWRSSLSLSDKLLTSDQQTDESNNSKAVPLAYQV